VKVRLERWQNGNRYFFKAYLEVPSDEEDFLIYYPEWGKVKIFQEYPFGEFEMHACNPEPAPISPKEVTVRNLLMGGLQVSADNPWFLKGLEIPIKNTLEKIKQEILVRKEYGSSNPSFEWTKGEEEINIDLK
jgi:hypothetical protein